MAGVLDKPTAANMERRKSKREDIGRHLLHIDAGAGLPPLICFLWDISEGGARLQLQNDVTLPPEVSLIIGNVTRRARVVWRNGIQLGVAFLQPALDAS